MTVVAQDTKNEFADAWNDRPSALPDAIGQDPSRSAEENEYRAAWDRENHGIYGSTHRADLAPLPTAPAAAANTGFRQQSVPWTQLQRHLLDSGRNPWMMGGSPEGWLAGPPGTLGDGGYGKFTYGMAAPEAGTAEYRDMSEYFANGGYDPFGMYGERKYGNEYMDAWNHGGGNSGNSVGGSAAADGSGGGSPGAM